MTCALHCRKEEPGSRPLNSVTPWLEGAGEKAATGEERGRFPELIPGLSLQILSPSAESD